MTRRIVQWLVIAVVVIGYPLLAHYTNEPSHDPSLGAVVAVTPVLLIALVLAWKSAHRPVMLGIVAVSCLALAAAWRVLENHFDLVYWLQNIGMQLILFMTFGRTLIAGRQPLCTRFAVALYGPISPEHEIYTRQVTLAWALFFAAMALVSTLLFFLAPLALWSVFANFLTLPLVALMFVAEFTIRRSVLPDIGHMHILDALRAYRNDSAQTGQSSPN